MVLCLNCSRPSPCKCVPLTISSATSSQPTSVSSVPVSSNSIHSSSDNLSVLASAAATTNNKKRKYASRLSDDDRRRVIDSFLCGKTFKDIAGEFGDRNVCIRTIQSVIRVFQKQKRICSLHPVGLNKKYGEEQRAMICKIEEDDKWTTSE